MTLSRQHPLSSHAESKFWAKTCFPTVLGENREVIERTERGQKIDFL